MPPDGPPHPCEAPAGRAAFLRRTVAGLCLLSFWLLCGFGPPRLTDSDTIPALRILPGSASPAALQGAANSLTAAAALVYDLGSGNVLFEHNAETALPPASLTKLLTALLTFETGNLQQPVTIMGADLVGNASMGLAAGEVLTLEELLYGMLIPSGNDAAGAIARHLGGSVESFVATMNQRAAQLGLTQSHFLTPTGLDRSGQTASARDLLALALLNWREPLFREIVALPNAEVAGHSLKSTNVLLGPLPDLPGVEVIGLKTGTTDAAGQCLIAAFRENAGATNERTTFIVVLGSSDRYRDVRSLYAAVHTIYRRHSARASHFAALNRLVTTQGAPIYLRATGQPFTALLRPWQIDQLTPVRILTQPDQTAWLRGAEVGHMEWRLGAQVLARQPLVVR